MATGQKPRKGSELQREAHAYACKIIELRREAHLTQLRLAKELRVQRGAVARWEAGIREPRPGTYFLLSAMAGDRHLQSLQDFFLSRMDKRSAERARRDREVYAGRELARVESEAAGTGEQAERAKHLLRLSEMNSTELAKSQAQRIGEARRSLSNGEFEAALFDIVEETHSAVFLALGRRCEVAAAIKRLDRQVDQFIGADSVIAENEKILREKIENILAEAEAAIRHGRQSDVIAILKKIPKAYAPLVRRLSGRQGLIDRWIALGGLLEKYRDADRDQKEDEKAALLKEVERLLNGAAGEKAQE